MRKPAVLFLLLTLLRIGFGSFFIVTGALKIPQLDVTAEFLTRSRLLPEFCSLPLASLGDYRRNMSAAAQGLYGSCFLGRNHDFNLFPPLHAGMGTRPGPHLQLRGSGAPHCKLPAGHGIEITTARWDERPDLGCAAETHRHLEISRS